MASLEKVSSISHDTLVTIVKNIFKTAPNIQTEQLNAFLTEIVQEGESVTKKKNKEGVFKNESRTEQWKKIEEVIRCGIILTEQRNNEVVVSCNINIRPLEGMSEQDRYRYLSRYIIGQIYTKLHATCPNRDEFHGKYIAFFDLSADTCIKCMHVTALLNSYPDSFFCVISHAKLYKFRKDIRKMVRHDLVETVTIRYHDSVTIIESRAFDIDDDVSFELIKDRAEEASRQFQPTFKVYAERPPIPTPRHLAKVEQYSTLYIYLKNTYKNDTI